MDFFRLHDIVESFRANGMAWLQSLFVLLLTWLAGYLFRRVIFYYFTRWSEKTATKLDDIFTARSRSHVLFWFFLLGIYAASNVAPIGKSTVVFAAKIVSALFLVSLTFLLANIASELMHVYGRRVSLSLPLTSLTENLARLIVMLLGILIVLSQLGISVTPLLTALGVGSLAVALALQDTLSNLFAGFYILANKQIRPGDYIRLDSGQEGYVIDIGWRTTRVRALPNNIILIPNAKIGSAIVTNFFLDDKEMAVIVQVGVSYSSDLDKVEKVTVEVARETLRDVAGGVKEFQPFIRFHTFGDSAIRFSVILRVREFVDQYLVTHEFVKRLHRRYNEEKITIPFPQRDVHLTQEAAPPPHI